MPKIIAGIVKGVRRKVDKRDAMAVRPASFSELVAPVGNSDDILDALERHGALLKDGGPSRSRQILVKGWPGGSKPRFYALNLAVLRELAAEVG